MVAQDTIALVYDFDGTLSPQPMQEYTILPALGISAEEFWQEVNDIADRDQAEPMLVYMHLLVKKMLAKGIPIRRQDLVAMGANLRYFPGVNSWFDRINDYVRTAKGDRFHVRHYIISAGLKEILEGCHLKPHFHNVFASEYAYNEYGAPSFPKLVITDTSKTQFLFRINKGLESPRQNINEHMQERQRPIPFSNIIYIGDGMTDVPSMAVVKQQGGHALAVYNPDDQTNSGQNTCRNLLQAKRIDFFAQADFRENSNLEQLTKLILDYTLEKMHFQNLLSS